MIDLHLSLRREEEKIYFLVNLIEYGYWTREDFARFRDFGDKFWAGEFDAIVLPRMNPPEPSCGNCNRRASATTEIVSDPNVAHGVPLCVDCYRKICDEKRDALEREMRRVVENQIGTTPRREGES